MGIHRLSIISILFPFFTVSVWAGGDTLLKPVNGEGRGKIVNGLQASAKAVKDEFGPGESVLINWKLVNVGDNPKRIMLEKGKNTFSQFSFAVRRSGRPVPVARKGDRALNQAAYVLAPGARRSLWIDLRSIDWTDATWLKPIGDYEVSMTFRGAGNGTAISTDWVRFRVAMPGTPLPRPKNPDDVEKVRRLIKQLGSEAFQKRQEAEEKLIAMGKTALGLLQEAIHSTEDAEIRLRCQRIMKRIQETNNGHIHKNSLCGACRSKAFTTDVGRCQHCRGGTPSGSWRYCRGCAVRLGRCAACARLLRVVKPPIPRPRPRPPIIRQPQPRPNPPAPPQPPIDDDF